MKQEKEIEVVTLMIRMYCKAHHKEARKSNNVDKKGLCPECQELLDYVELRRSKCIWGDDKPFCANCKIHCYNKEMKERIRNVMRYSGPRMMFSHPIIATRHVVETLHQKQVLAKQEKILEEKKQAKIAERKAKEAETIKVEENTTAPADTENKD